MNAHRRARAGEPGHALVVRRPVATTMQFKLRATCRTTTHHKLTGGNRYTGSMNGDVNCAKIVCRGCTLSNRSSTVTSTLSAVTT